MSASSAVFEDKSRLQAAQARGGTSMPGPDDDVDSWPWWLKIKGRPGWAERVRISELAQVRLTAIVSALTVESIAKTAGAGGDALVKSSQSALAEYGDWICGNDLAWLLRLRKKFKDLIPTGPGGWLPDPPKPFDEIGGRPEMEVLGELASLRMSLPSKSPLGMGIDHFLDGIGTRMETIARS